ncbi:MAG TPA: hypothetical protein VEY30_00595, partial [Myxococcaceae bacterium]|nr:hypothetical protein [Myxococcaceae bacterium]
NELDPATRVVLVDELARSGIGDGFAIAPVYFPACIQSAYRAYLHAGSPNALSEALVASLPMLARAMTDVRRLVADRTGDGMFAVDLKALAEVLKEPGSLHQWAFSFTEVTDGAVLTVARS